MEENKMCSENKEKITQKVVTHCNNAVQKLEQRQQEAQGIKKGKSEKDDSAFWNTIYAFHEIIFEVIRKIAIGIMRFIVFLIEAL